MHVAVVIPAYNEAPKIRGVVERARAQCDDVIVIDDGSIDGTAGKLEGLAITLVRHERNRGKAAALWTGFQRALANGADAVATLDGDGQHRPEDVQRLIDTAAKHPNTIVIGSRMHQRAAFPPSRYFGNQFANFWISWAAGYRIEDSQSGFRLYPTMLLKQLDLPHDPTRGFVLESEILIEAARRRVYSVPMPIDAIYSEPARASHYRNALDTWRITRMVAWKLISRGLYLQGLFRSLFLHSPPR